MRHQIFKLFNVFVGLIPRPILWRMLRALHYHPEIADRCGYTVYPQVFYSPFPFPHAVDLVKLKAKRDLPGIDFKVAESIKLLEALTKYSGEARDFLKNREGDTAKWDMT